MVTIDISATEYKPNRLIQIQKMDNGQYDEDFNEYKDKVSLLQKSHGYVNLIQKHIDDKILNQKKSSSLTFGKPMTVDLDNLKNMGYEGKFWFGNPSQEMQVIFDTGSAWAWLFSEKCDEHKCPAKNGRFH